jgi:hypothetical protein
MYCHDLEVCVTTDRVLDLIIRFTRPFTHSTRNYRVFIVQAY